MRFDYVYGNDVSRMYPSVSMAIEEITPEVAEKMLDVNVHNRNIKRLPYAKDMADGKWDLNGATIVFSDDGVLLDGQHRLWACIASGEPFVTIVVRGIPSAKQESMDIGSSRTLADMLKLKGYPSAEKLAAVAKALAKADKCGIEGGFCKSTNDLFTRSQLIAYVEDNYESMDLAKIVRISARAVGKKESISVWGVLIREFLKSGDDNTEEFVCQVKGTHTPSQQVHLLNEKLRKNRESTKTEQPKIVAAWIIKTWNAWMRGVDMKPAALRLTLGGAHPEVYPQIYVAGVEEC